MICLYVHDQVKYVTMTTEAHSGVAPITVNENGNHSYWYSVYGVMHTHFPTGENSIVIVSGANMTLRPADVRTAMPLIAGSKVVVCQLEVPPETSLEALQLAKAHSGT